MIDYDPLNEALLATFGIPVVLLDRPMTGILDTNARIDNLGYIAVDNEHPSVHVKTSQVQDLEVDRNETILVGGREYGVVSMGKPDDGGMTRINLMRVIA